MAERSSNDEQRWNDFNPPDNPTTAHSSSIPISSRITAYLPKEQYDMLQKLATKKKASMSQILRESLSPYEKEYRSVDYPIPLSPSLPVNSGRNVRITAHLTPTQHLMLKHLAKLWRTSMSRVLSEAVAELYVRSR